MVDGGPRRQGLNWYAYCLNNPLTMVDPNGKFARISVDNNNNVSIVLPIRFIENRYSTPEKIKNDIDIIQNTFTGQIGKYNVTMRVEQLENIDLSKMAGTVICPTYFNIVEIGAPTYLNSAGDSLGYWWYNTDPATVAEEAGHLAGARDHYTRKDEYSPAVPNDGWKDYLYGGAGASTVNEKTIEEMINTYGNTGNATEYQNNVASHPESYCP